MRTRRAFSPAVDLMPSRVSPSVAGLAHVVVSGSGIAAQHQGAPPSGMMPMATPTSYPIIAGDPTPPPRTLNC